MPWDSQITEVVRGISLTSSFIPDSVPAGIALCRRKRYQQSSSIERHRACWCSVCFPQLASCGTSHCFHGGYLWHPLLLPPIILGSVCAAHLKTIFEYVKCAKERSRRDIIRNYSATIRVGDSILRDQTVAVVAKTPAAARAKLEAEYGVGNVVDICEEVDAAHKR